MTTKNLPALDDLARRVNEEHEACRTAMRSAVEHAGTMKPFSQNLEARGYHKTRIGGSGRMGFEGLSPNASYETTM